MNPTINNPRSPFTRSRGIFGSMGSFVFTDQQQQQQPGLQVPPEGSADKNGLNAMPFLGQIHTSPLLSRPMGPIGHGHPPTFPPMGDSDGFNAVPQMASMGPPPVLSSLWTGGASPDSRGEYYDDPHEEYSDCRYEGDYEGDYSMPTEEDQEEESCSCQSQTCQSQSEFSLIERTESDLRQLLWRMANARGEEALVFFAVLMTTPWLFSLSLLGFILSLAALLKKTCAQHEHVRRS
ncbi:uncharacterized protein LOC117195132 [Drosophila miranda]|uniref:uncharacterized protein LOC117195132 n=1 Tax=Drosophila miranda TaxID=7229 RepID=UPI00143FACBA|nr:uncharacterized protein LOC117195132 [Drosophila miranda]